MLPCHGLAQTVALQPNRPVFEYAGSSMHVLLMHSLLFSLPGATRGLYATPHSNSVARECARLRNHRHGEKDPGVVLNVFCATRRY